MSDPNLSALEAAATERAADGLSGMNVSPLTVLALIAELRDSRARIADSAADGAHWHSLAEAAEQKVAALAEVIEQVRTLAEDPERHLVRWIDDSHLVDVSDLKGILAAAPTLPTEAECPTDCDEDCTAECHATHHPTHKKDHPDFSCRPTPPTTDAKEAACTRSTDCPAHGPVFHTVTDFDLPTTDAKEADK